jgi:ethanolamine utilization protein EutJ
MLMRASPAVETSDSESARVNAFLASADQRLRHPAPAHGGTLRFGIDLGTATIVLTAVDAAGTPIYWNFMRERVVRDGVVVDFQGAVRAVVELKRIAEAALGESIAAAATAHPPEVALSDCRACAYVLQQAGIDCRRLVDEVSAANAVLAVRDGAVAQATQLAAGGGHHLDLILAGALRIPVEEAESRKREHGVDVLAILRPGVERVAESIRSQCGNVCPGVIHLAGGALQIPGAAAVVEHYLGWAAKSYAHAELITPFGIALS